MVGSHQSHLGSWVGRENALKAGSQVELSDSLEGMAGSHQYHLGSCRGSENLTFKVGSQVGLIFDSQEGMVGSHHSHLGFLGGIGGISPKSQMTFYLGD